jgi:hypothetical protein
MRPAFFARTPTNSAATTPIAANLEEVRLGRVLVAHSSVLSGVAALPFGWIPARRGCGYSELPLTHVRGREPTYSLPISKRRQPPQSATATHPGHGHHPIRGQTPSHQRCERTSPGFVHVPRGHAPRRRARASGDASRSMLENAVTHSSQLNRSCVTPQCLPTRTERRADGRLAVIEWHWALRNGHPEVAADDLVAEWLRDVEAGCELASSRPPALWAPLGVGADLME